MGTESLRLHHPPSETAIRLTRTLTAALLALGSLALSAGHAWGQNGATSPTAPPPTAPDAEPAPGVIDVIEVNGRIDDVVVDFITRSLEKAQASGAEVFVVQLNSPGSLVDVQALDVLVFRFTHGGVPVAVWVGQSGARAYGDAVVLLEAAGYAGMAPGTRIGKVDDRRAPPEIRGSKTLAAEPARRAGLIDTVTPTLGDFIVGLDGVSVNGRELNTARVVVRDDTPRREASGQVRFSKLGLLERLLHTASSPPVAYIFLVAGLLLIVFEFYAVGIGLAGMTGAGCLLMAAYGLAALPTSWVGLALIAVAVFGYAIDVQAGAPRSWTGIGTVAFAAGSWLLWSGDLRLSIVTILLGVISVALFMVAGVPSVVRARFSTPTIGRESMVGEEATVVTALAPEGTVRCRGGLWRARAHRARPSAVGETVKVVAIEGLVLEVERATSTPDGASS